MSKKGYCDYRCWYAKGKQCSCFCSGANHGIGKMEDDPESGFHKLLKDPIIKQYGFTQLQWELYVAGNITIDAIVQQITANFNLDPEIVEMRRNA